MKILRLLLTITMLVGFTSLINAQSKESEIKKMLEDRDEEIKNIVGPKNSTIDDSKRNELKDIVNNVIDFEEMAKYALDEHYNTIETDEKEEFVDLFATIVRDQSLTKLDIYRANVSYNSITVEDAKATVNTMAELEDVRTPVGYKMLYKNNEWVITDMIIDDVSTAESYHRQFQRIISQRGFDALLQSLRKRAERA